MRVTAVLGRRPHMRWAEPVKTASRGAPVVRDKKAPAPW